MQRIIAVLFIGVLIFTACAPRSSSSSTEPRIVLEDCALTPPNGEQVDARCGTLHVPEDRSNPSGRQIELRIAVVPAVQRTSEPDPLFLLAGGPGQSAIETFPSLINILFPIHEERDIVLVDQRGTGMSNPLRCLDPEDETLSEEEVLDLLKACPPTLEADLRLYTTEIAMTDLDAVREALGYEQINLYGASYGTRAALTYLRLFPDRVRTLTLDAVVDPGFVIFMDAATDGQAALDSFFARCEADSECRTAFPDLRTEFHELLARLEESPADITLAHPVTGKPLDVTVTRSMLTRMVFNTLYVPDLVATLPVAIHAAHSQENYAPLISQGFVVNAGLYDGMFYAVACTEDAPFIASDLAAQRAQDSIFGDVTVEFVETCSAWPRGEVSASFREPLVSDVPTLLLSGQADPITPPRHAETLAESLTNERHLIFEGMGHGNLTNRCSLKIFQEFLEEGTVEDLDTSCVEGVRPPPFFVDFSGPRP
jgi:pimeloyl-ACP methyl ester carboxylesterase